MIISKMLLELSKGLKENQYQIKFDQSIKKQVKLASSDSLYGYRPLKRYIQSNIEIN